MLVIIKIYYKAMGKGGGKLPPFLPFPPFSPFSPLFPPFSPFPPFFYHCINTEMSTILKIISKMAYNGPEYGGNGGIMAV